MAEIGNFEHNLHLCHVLHIDMKFVLLKCAYKCESYEAVDFLYCEDNNKMTIYPYFTCLILICLRIFEKNKIIIAEY